MWVRMVVCFYVLETDNHAVQGVPCLLPCGSWDRLESPHDPNKDKWKRMEEWRHVRSVLDLSGLTHVRSVLDLRCRVCRRNQNHDCPIWQTFQFVCSRSDPTEKFKKLLHVCTPEKRHRHSLCGNLTETLETHSLPNTTCILVLYFWVCPSHSHLPC